MWSVLNFLKYASKKKKKNSESLPCISHNEKMNTSAKTLKNVTHKRKKSINNTGKTDSPMLKLVNTFKKTIKMY